MTLGELALKKIIFILMVPFLCFSHTPKFGASKSGYGYLLPNGTEFEADHILSNHECKDLNIEQAVKPYCKQFGDTFIANQFSTSGSTFGSKQLDFMVYNEIRDKIFELKTMQFLSACSALKDKKVSDCFPQKLNCFDTERMKNIKKYASLYSEGKKAKDLPNDQGFSDFVEKFNKIQDKNSPASLAEAIIIEDYLKKQREYLNCNGKVYDPKEKEFCIHNTIQIERIRQTHPMLFFSSGRSFSGPMQGPYVFPTDYRDAFKKNLTAFIGSYRIGNLNATYKESITEGHNFFTEIKGDDLETIQDSLSFMKYVHVMMNQVDNPVYKNNIVIQKMLKSYNALISTGYNDFHTGGLNKGIRKRGVVERLEGDLNKLCQQKEVKPDKMNLYRTISNNPLAVKQLYLEAEPKFRKLLSAYLCKVGMRSFQIPKDCQGVEQEEDENQQELRILDDESTFYPYSSTRGYRIIKDKKTGDTKLKMDIKTVYDPKKYQGYPDKDQNGIPDMIDCTVKAWSENFNGTHNCKISGQAFTPDTSNYVKCDKSGKRTATPGKKCEKDPSFSEYQKVKFEVKFSPTTIKEEDCIESVGEYVSDGLKCSPSINLHPECFHTEYNDEKNTDCKFLTEQYMSSCTQLEMFKQSNCQTGCEEKAKKICEQKIKNDPQEIGRVDAGNLTAQALDYKVMRHEILHLFGLDDEYESSERPSALIGDEKSVMNSGKELFPYHLNKILTPKECY